MYLFTVPVPVMISVPLAVIAVNDPNVVHVEPLLECWIIAVMLGVVPDTLVT